MESARVKELALALTTFPSVTDSPGEGRFAPFLRDMLAAWPCFAQRPGDLRLLRTLDDGVERHVLAALARRPGAARGVDAGSFADAGPTVILTGHYDVVSSACYGALEGSAFDPVPLARGLVAELEAGERAGRLGEDEARAHVDLRSGEFIPGRGLLDMKAGLAAGLALLEEFSGGGIEAPGSLLFLAVPDEEGSSHGMLSAVRLLPELLREWGARPVAAINLDASVDQGAGERVRAVFLGSVGKLHPFALFVGRPSHAGAPFDGVNPALLAAEFARRIECSGGLFAPRPGGAREAEPPSPPTILYHRDLRDHYDVTTPGSVFVSANLLVHDRGPAEALDAVSRIAAEAMEAGLGLLRERAAAYSLASGSEAAIPDRPARVLGWAGLEAAARAAAPQAYEEARAKALAAPDRMEALAALAAEAARLAGLEGPAAVVGLAPPYYPRASLDTVRDARLLELIRREAAAFEAEGKGAIALRPFFPGISDMSFLYPGDEAQARKLASEACPLGLDPLPAGFSCPAVNIGPWGREYHQRLERVHADYAFRLLPELLRRVALAFLREGA